MGSVIDRANIKAQGVEDKFYIGGTNNFKARLGFHKQSLKKKEEAKDSALAEQVWLWREQGLQPEVNFTVVRRAKPYSPEAGKCMLCIQEKLEIARALEDPQNVNKKSELMGHCLHKPKFLLANVDMRGFREGIG